MELHAVGQLQLIPPGDSQVGAQNASIPSPWQAGMPGCRDAGAPRTHRTHSRRDEPKPAGSQDSPVSSQHVLIHTPGQFCFPASWDWGEGGLPETGKWKKLGRVNPAGRLCRKGGILGWSYEVLLLHKLSVVSLPTGC